MWDARTYQQLAVLKGHDGVLTSVAVTTDGARLVSASLDKTQRVWDFHPNGQKLVEAAQAIAPRCLTLAERQRHHLAPALVRCHAKMAV